MYLLLKKFYFHIWTFMKTIYKNTDKFVALIVQLLAPAATFGSKRLNLKPFQYSPQNL